MFEHAERKGGVRFHGSGGIEVGAEQLLDKVASLRGSVAPTEQYANVMLAIEVDGAEVFAPGDGIRARRTVTVTELQGQAGVVE